MLQAEVVVVVRQRASGAVLGSPGATPASSPAPSQADTHQLPNPWPSLTTATLARSHGMAVWFNSYCTLLPISAGGVVWCPS
jgi:hypothetical protein